MEPQTNKFEGWAVVEMFGHTKEIGFVTTQYFGTACLFRIDVPALPEREFVLKSPRFARSADNPDLETWCRAGSKVKHAASLARSPLVGPGAIYKITPCTEATAMRALDEIVERPLVLLELSKDAPQLPGEIGDEEELEPEETEEIL